MPSCIVKGCKHHTSTKTSNPLFTMHVFPREFRRIKLWLQQMNQDFGDIDAFAAKILEAANTGKYRICSAHFEPGCYTAIGRRLLLKPDAMPTIFPGMCPQPTDWRLFPLPPVGPHFGPQPVGPPIPHENLDQLKSGLLKKDAVTQTNEERHPSINTSLMEKCNVREEIFDSNGRLIGVFSPDTKQRDLKMRPGLWTYDWSTKISDKPSTTQRTMENKEALSSLEKVLFSLLQNMAETPHSRPQKQRTSRLLNRFADLISILTGEEWTVVKKNAHISKFYNMIREVPIKCGDVAMFFSMDEWDYIEEHEDLYKPVMLENAKDAKDTITDTATDSHEDLPEEKPVVDESLRAAATNPSAGEEVPAAVQANSDCAPATPAAPAIVIKKEEEELVPCTKQPTDHTTAAPHYGPAEQSSALPPVPVMNPSTDHTTAAPHYGPAERSCALPPVPVMNPSTAEACNRGMVTSSMESESSELWIAEDGTTSTRWMPQEETSKLLEWPHVMYCRGVEQSLISLPWCAGPNVNRGYPSPEPSGMKRPTPESIHHCDQCDEHFPDQWELIAHRKTHVKKQRQ